MVEQDLALGSVPGVTCEGALAPPYVLGNLLVVATVVVLFDSQLFVAVRLCLQDVQLPGQNCIWKMVNYFARYAVFPSLVRRRAFSFCLSCTSFHFLFLSTFSIWCFNSLVLNPDRPGV